jgi:alginate O-acetyltransferase complex protein AlgI
VLFNSFIFIFGFLPLALLLTYIARPYSTPAKAVLTILSLGFYAWWYPPHLALLLASIVFNYLVGDRIQQAYAADQSAMTSRWLTLGIVVDLAMLGWFKYADFVAHNVGLALHHNYDLPRIALPLAISFFTFQKIAYLIDSSRGQAKKMTFLDFSLFAAFFPQLISGPIVHYGEVVPQLMNRGLIKRFGRNLLIGLVIFAIGLFKKTVIADSLALFANPVFDAASKGQQLDPLTGWLAAITFTLQLYFDFSGYSDMAIGLGRMFGVKLPLNFHSPLKAVGIIEYWRRWHMTLQRFILAYIFEPLTLPLSRWAARRGLSTWPEFALSVALPSIVTFVAVGVWHGAGWTFVLFGVMHATYICINQFWRRWQAQRRRFLKRQGKTLSGPTSAQTVFFHLITLVAVLLGNVMFRSKSVGAALIVWRGMAGLDVASSSIDSLFAGVGFLTSLVISTIIVFFLPNTQQIMRRFNPAANWAEWSCTASPAIRWSWRASPAGLVFAGITLFLGVMFIQRGEAVFIYFNF